MKRTSRIFVAGGSTLAGAALLECLREQGYTRLLGVPPAEPDLTCRGQVDDFFAETRPEYVFLVAGKSGGIGLNRARPAELMLDNLLVTAHVLHAAHENRVTRLLYLASSCAYPRQAPQPLASASLLQGAPEETSRAYATAKLAGWQLALAYRRQYGDRFLTAIPANPFGPQDDFSAEGGHVIPALLRRTHEARQRGDAELLVWGTGTPRREFLYSRDLADACLFVLRHYEGEEPINLGGGAALTIAETAQAILDVVGFTGRLIFDPSRPDGMPLKALDTTPLAALGWRPRTPFRTALEETYAWFLQHVVREDPEDVSAAVSRAVPDSPGGRRDRSRVPLGSDQEPCAPVDRAGSCLGGRV